MLATEYDDFPNYLPDAALPNRAGYYASFRYGAIADSCNVLIKVADTAEECFNTLMHRPLILPLPNSPSDANRSQSNG